MSSFTLNMVFFVKDYAYHYGRVEDFKYIIIILIIIKNGFRNLTQSNGLGWYM